MRKLIPAVLLGLLVLSPLVRAADETPPPPVGKTDEYPLKERMHSSYKKYIPGGSRGVKFYDFRRSIMDSDRASAKPKELLDYEIEDQKALVYVPQDYDEKQAYGVLLHLTDDKAASLPDGWDKVCDQHKLIFASPHNAGDLWGDLRRLALLQDTLATLKKDFTIDDKRIYLSGASSGAGVVQILALDAPSDYRAVIAMGYGLIMQRTIYNREEYERRKKDGDKVTPDTWDPQTSFLSTSDLKKVGKADLDIVLYSTSSAPYEEERIAYSAHHWYKLGVPVLPILGANSRIPLMPATILGSALRFIEGERVKVPLVSFEKYEIRLELEQVWKNKKAIEEEPQDAGK